MKTRLHLILFVTLGTMQLSAAEPVGYKWNLYNIEGKNQYGETPITPEQPAVFSPDQETRWGAGLTVHFTDVEPEALYRVRIDCKSTGPAGFHYRLKGAGKWVSFVPVNKGVVTLFVRPLTEKENGIQLSFGKKGGPLEIRSITVEKLNPQEYTSNLLVNDGLEPGFWRCAWGKEKKEDTFSVQLKKDRKSPMGEVLLLPETQLDDGHKSTLLLPFLPKRKYEISFWLRSSEPAAIMCQIVYGGLKHSQIGLKTEWTEYKFTGETPEEAPKNGMWLMFLRFKDGTPAFEVGGVDFHYLP